MIDTLPWHQPTIDRLAELAERDRLPNAIALTCAPGWGHEQLLAQVALTLLGAQQSGAIEEFAHPDFRWVAPEGAVIKIDQVRKLNEFSVQTVQLAPRKVAAVLNAHLLNANAANALLKTLEEPPPNTHLILATPFWGKLLPTIRSRCQRFAVATDQHSAQAWLVEQGVVTSDTGFAEMGYAPLTAREATYEDQPDLTEWLSQLSLPRLEDAVKQVVDGDVVLWLSRWYRRILQHLSGQPIPQCTATNQALLLFSDDLLDIRRQIEASNAANTKLMLEQLVVRWVQIQRSQRR